MLLMNYTNPHKQPFKIVPLNSPPPHPKTPIQPKKPSPQNISLSLFLTPIPPYPSHPFPQIPTYLNSLKPHHIFLNPDQSQSSNPCRQFSTI